MANFKRICFIIPLLLLLSINLISVKAQEYKHEYEVKYICKKDHSPSTDFPIPHSFSSEIDCSNQEDYIIKLIPLRASYGEYIYEIVLPNGITTDHIINIKNGSGLGGKIVELVFLSLSAEKPAGQKYKDYPKYYTTQFYRVYTY